MNKSDISSIPPWKFEEDLSDDEDSVHYGNPSLTTTEDHDLPNDDDELPSNEVHIGGEQIHNQPRNTTTRSGRSVRTPSRFGDYVM